MDLINKIRETYGKLSTKVKLGISIAVVGVAGITAGTVGYNQGFHRGQERGEYRGYTDGYHFGRAEERALMFHLVPGSEQKYNLALENVVKEMVDREFRSKPQLNQ
jgi:hypothetical protein